MKLELKHLAPYLPYKLMLYMEGFPYVEMDEIKASRNINNFLFKPMLKPLSDLPEDMIESFGYKNSRWYLMNIIKNQQLPYKHMEELLQNHFDVFGLIDAGLAIDINTLTPSTL